MNNSEYCHQYPPMQVKCVLFQYTDTYYTARTELQKKYNHVSPGIKYQQSLGHRAQAVYLQEARI